MKQTDDEIRGLVIEAMVENPPRTLVFDYLGGDGVPRTREAEPYRFDPANMRVFCHCLTAEDVRWFSFRKMDSVSIGQAFKPRMNITTPL